VTPGRRLLAPARGVQLTGPPRLQWTRVRRARYYNVQLFRGDRKVLSAWPRKAHLQLHPSWRFAGHARHLRPGRYTWWVWPGRGPRVANRYGARLGRRAFVVAKP
jgi:hypothetical protein